MKKAFITGINGQDGSYLAEFLLNKGYQVAGLIRRTSTPNLINISNLLKDIKIYDGDLLDQGSIDRVIKDFKPNEVYNLAAQSFVKSSWNQPILTGDVTGLGAVRVLESLRNISPETKFYQASSSEMFGNTKDEFISEESQFFPTSPYAIAKLYAHNMSINYRNSYKMFCSNGILFNHESPRRGIEFVTRKITYSLACIACNVKTSKMGNEQKEPLVNKGKFKLGNLDASRDWGFAGDYIEAMWKMLQQIKSDDFVIATGKSYSIRDFLDKGFKYIGKDDWEKYVEIDERFKRPSELLHLRGNAEKARNELEWSPKTNLDKLIKMMIDSDIKLVKLTEK